MNVGELRKRVADAMGENGNPKRINDVIDRVFETIAEVLAKDGRVRIAALGTFKVVKSAPRTGRNMQTGGFVHIPAGRKVVFRPAKTLRTAVARPPRRASGQTKKNACAAR